MKKTDLNTQIIVVILEVIIYLIETFKQLRELLQKKNSHKNKENYEKD